jgi:hypothetical protein
VTLALPAAAQTQHLRACLIWMDRENKLKPICALLPAYSSGQDFAW